MKRADCAVIHALELATPLGSRPAFGKETAKLRIIKDASIGAFEGKIVFAGTHESFKREVSLDANAPVIDASGMTVIPGFVDSHTHLPFAGYRDDEFMLRMSGAGYEEIARKGGGIRNTVRTTREASREELVRVSLERLDRMLLHGTTTCEAKSGYGLTLEDEIKQLEAIREVSAQHPLSIVPTFLGAHTMPVEFADKRNEYIDLISGTMIPAIAKRGLAEFCDVFCDEHGFAFEECRQVLSAARNHRLKVKVHADQFGSSGGSRLAAEFGAHSADHLEHISDEDIGKLAGAKIVGVLLPGSVYFLKKSRYAPARRMLDAGMACAIATDFNPGSSMTESMQQIVQLAVFLMDVSVAEALTMATLNGAAALDRADRTGSLEEGKDADIVIMDIPNHAHLAYHFGINHCFGVIKKGKICVERRRRIDG